MAEKTREAPVSNFLKISFRNRTPVFQLEIWVLRQHTYFPASLVRCGPVAKF